MPAAREWPFARVWMVPGGADQVSVHTACVEQEVRREGRWTRCWEGCLHCDIVVCILKSLEIESLYLTFQRVIEVFLSKEEDRTYFM